MPNLAAFLSYVFITTFTPGPNNIMSMSNASLYGFKKSMMFFVGVFAGFAVMMALSSVFGITLYNLIPSIKPVMTYIGAAYILWLAWKTYKSKPHTGNESDKHTNTFWAGMLLQFVNPKGILYAVTTVSTFIIPYYKSVPVLAGFSVLLAFIAFVSNCCWGLFGSVFQKFLIRNDRVINTVMSLLLAYCSVSLFL